MIIETKIKSHVKPVHEWFHLKKYQSDNLTKMLYTNNQQKRLSQTKIK